ncbi:peptide/nickel transport system permease protein [Kribbella sp. VKM Ac-2569]|uniref:ABC transporter permease subunit n=1 Tax=Kribbella sp. VKM Ac-2569 TaxID=2512220 RepID=UPI00102AA829|nr:ABC transporter permease subunit [Kribbella sp. VKM Ac-2569]RZT16868.1 peptide/nickel transport system permease protein [Kribbella sp. VKM Ac-2569]
MRERVVGVLSRAGALAVVVAAIGLLPWLSGRDVALSVLRARAAEQEPTAEAIEAVRNELGLDAGPLALLARWFGGVVRGDFGTSWANGAEVLPSIVTAAGASLTLMAAALGIALAIAAAICVPTLVRGARGTLRAKGNGILATSLAALPEFLLATLLMLTFAVWLGWLPPYGWEGPTHLVLPAVALALPAGGILGRLVVDALPAVFAERWVSLWRSAGCTPRSIAAAAVRRATPAVVPQLGLVAVGLTGGAVAVETVFAIPGIGRTALGAAESQDLPLLQGAVLALILLGVAAGLLAQTARRRLLGRALRDQALSLPVTPAVPAGRLTPVVCAVVLAVVIGWGLTLDPLHLDTTARLATPSWDHPLGTDSLGRDVLARVGHGAVTTIGTAVVVCAVSFVIALGAGLRPVAAEGVSEIANAVPPVIAGILVVAVLGPGTLGASIAVALVSWPPLAAHAAALTQETRAAAYLTAQKAIGASRTWILTRHVLPAVVGPVARHAVLRLPGIALALASLGFLGLGSQPPAPEWGSGLAESLPYVERAPWATLAPAIMLLVLAALAVSLSTGRRR